MKKTLFLLFITLLTGPASGQDSLSVYDCYTNAITPVQSISPSDTNFSDLNFLRNLLKDKKIVILGESSHGDGSTFEAKTRLIEFLTEELGFSTIAFEGGGFWEMYYACQNILKGRDTETEISNSWFSIWSSSRQTQDLIRFIDKHKDKVHLLGIEDQLGNQYSVKFAGILDSLVGPSAYKGVDLSSFDKNLLTYYYSAVIDTSYSNKVDLPALLTSLAIIKKNLSGLSGEHAAAMLQGIRNIEGFMKQMELNKGNYTDQNKAINVRDSLMADNVIWYLHQHPEEKIIIWTANLHAARNLDQIIYREDDNFYQIFKPMGQHLYDKYGDEIFTLAFTSVSGETATVFQQYPDSIKLNINTIDFQLGQTINGNYAIVDYMKIREQKKCLNRKFISTVLGYNEHCGNWFKVFDGLFFIRKMQRSEMK